MSPRAAFAGRTLVLGMMFLLLLAGVRRVRNPGPVLRAIGAAPGPLSGGPGAPAGARLVFAVQLMDCPDLRDVLSDWIVENGIAPGEVHGVLLGPSGSLEQARAILDMHDVNMTLDARGAHAITRFLRQAGYDRTPVALLFDERGRLVRLLDGPTLTAEVTS